MFTGITQGLFKIHSVERKLNLTHYSVELSPDLLTGLQIGASVAVDGVCQSVVQIQSSFVYFDAIEETLKRTTLSDLKVGRKVNIERAARFGDEIGGHLLSGHVFGKVQILEVISDQSSHIIKLACPQEWIKYLFPKGFIAIDGCSLTLVEVNPSGFFTVHLIPETLRISTWGFRQKGDWVNLEFDAQTMAIVETVDRILKNSGKF